MLSTCIRCLGVRQLLLSRHDHAVDVVLLLAHVRGVVLVDHVAGRLVVSDVARQKAGGEGVVAPPVLRLHVAAVGQVGEDLGPGGAE